MIISIVYAVLLLTAGFILARITATKLTSFLDKKYSLKNTSIIKRLAFYGILIIFVVMALHQLGFNLSVLLGAAGILSVAIGFASQTSMSNVISGLFLLGEGAFSVGDVIKVGSTTGEVISIDWISVKLRTPDNMYVRIPNELIVKTEMTNLTRFPIRRFDFNFSIAYREDIARVKALILALVHNSNQCLEDPEPMIVVESFADSGIGLRLAVWAKSENFLKFRSQLAEDIKALLDRENIEIPFPHLSLYAGQDSSPIKVSVERSES